MTGKTRFVALLLLLAVGCKNDSKTQAALNDVEQDTSLARDLALAGADTLLYAEAADVAMSEDTTTRLVPRGEGRRPAADIPAAPAPEPRASIPDIPAPRPRASAPSERVPQRAEANPTVSVPAAPAVRAGACGSPAAADQRRCLMQYLARSDASLNRTYQRVIGQLGPGEEERLRVAQRAWLVYRDRECRRKTRSSEGELWAPVRARCLGEYSAARERELTARLQ